jgi:hypothetical protein
MQIKHLHLCYYKLLIGTTTTTTTTTTTSSSSSNNNNNNITLEKLQNEKIKYFSPFLFSHKNGFLITQVHIAASAQQISKFRRNYYCFVVQKFGTYYK